MIDVVEISREVLGRLTTIGYEKNGIVSSGQLIFPSKSDDKRISEQELRQLFIEEFKDKYKTLYFSIETPTVCKYSFTNELNEIKVSENGQSALLDMCILNKKDNKSNYYRLLNIEFKHKNATEANISKDILKLMHEEENGAFILLLKNTDAGTLPCVFKKFSNSFETHKKQWKGEKDKFIQLVIISLEEETNKNKTAFFTYKNIFENDLETIKKNIGNEWI